MLSLRYAIRQIDINMVSACSALKKAREAERNAEVCFSEIDAISMPVIIKQNSLLFQALEQIKAEEGEERSVPTHGVSEKFLGDLAVLLWSSRIDNEVFLAHHGEDSISMNGERLRKLMFTEGFMLGNVKMVPLLSGAGYSREGKYLFINEKYRGAAMERITLGLVSADSQGNFKLGMKKNISVNMAKLSAYIGLADSDGQSLRELEWIWKSRKGKDGEKNPAKVLAVNASSVVVVRDVYGSLGITNIGRYMIANDNDDSEDQGAVKLKRLGSEDVANYTDGYGFISKAWSEAINQLRHCRKPDSFHNRVFIIRAPFVKGAVVECDFARYLHEKGRATVRDIYGKEHPVDQIGMILTQSMFKGKKFFGDMKRREHEAGSTDWDYYMQKLKEAELSMVIVGSDSAPAKERRINYQFLASLQPDEQALERLTEIDRERQKKKLELLELQSPPDLTAYANAVAEYLEQSVRVKAEKEEILSDGDEPKDSNDANEGNLNDEVQPQSTDYAALLARLIRRYPEIATTRVVKEELAAVAVKDAMDISQGRLTVAADSRILVGDPMELLNWLAEGPPVDTGAETRGRVSRAADTQNNLLQAMGWVYAPGLERHQRLLLMRNPHVSVFEAMVANHLDAKDAEAKDGRERYFEYFGEHTGCIFINSAIAASLGGADFDGDRAMVCFDEHAIALARSNVEKIYSLLRRAEQNGIFFPEMSGGDGDAQPRFSEEAVKNGMALPIVGIQPFPQKNIPVDRVNQDFWGETFESYLTAICSQVGKYSIEAATRIFNRGTLTNVDLESPDAVKEAVEMMKLMARMTTVIGLDIDAAKSGQPPKRPSMGDGGRRCGLLRFSRYVKKKGSASFNGFSLYRAALNAANDEIVDAATSPFLLTSAVAGSRLVKDFSLEAHYETLKRWQPLEPGKSPPKGEPLFSNVLCRDLENAELDARMEEAVRRASEKVRFARDVRSEANQLVKESRNIQTQRANVLQHLLARYPLETALALNRAIVNGCSAPFKGKKLELWHDEDLLPYAFISNSQRQEKLKAAIFANESDAGFVYEEDCYQLAKHAQRLRESIRKSNEALRRIRRNGGAARPILYGELKDEIDGIAKQMQVSVWELGRWLLKKGKIGAMMFVIMFTDCAPKEEGKQEHA